MTQQESGPKWIFSFIKSILIIVYFNFSRWQIINSLLQITLPIFFFSHNYKDTVLKKLHTHAIPHELKKILIPTCIFRRLSQPRFTKLSLFSSDSCGLQNLPPTQSYLSCSRQQTCALMLTFFTATGCTCAQCEVYIRPSLLSKLSRSSRLAGIQILIIT